MMGPASLLTPTVDQGCSQPHSPGWARVPLSSFFLKFWSILLILPQTFLIFFLILALRVGDSPTREGPGYATAVDLHDVFPGMFYEDDIHPEKQLMPGPANSAIHLEHHQQKKKKKKVECPW